MGSKVKNRQKYTRETTNLEWWLSEAAEFVDLDGSREKAARSELAAILAEVDRLRGRVATMEQACKAVHEHALLEIEHGLPLVARPVVELMEVALALPPRKWSRKG